MRQHLFIAWAVFFLIGGCTDTGIHTAPLPVEAETQKLDTGSATFPVPAKINGRVAFWVAVYGQYGKYHRIVHHRMFPQAVFTVLDFYDEAKRMGPGELEAHIARTEKGMVEHVAEVLRYFAAGGSPRNNFERQCYNAMKLVPGGNEKYTKAVDEDLIRTQTGIKERFQEAIQRSGRYLRFMEEVFAERGLPRELAKLPFVESSFDYRVVSSVGASGLWQFMRRTGREYGMRISNVIDERRDPIIATQAAAQYLQSAYRRLDSWPLAITSYNHGVAGVAQKVKQMGTRDLTAIIEHPTDRPLGFASNNFYPSFLAALVVNNNIQKYFPGTKLDPPLKLRESIVSKGTSVRELSRALKVSIEDLQVANYALSDAVWNGRAMIPSGYRVRIPERGIAQEPAVIAAAQPVAEKPIVRASVDLDSDTNQKSSRYTVQKGDTIGSIARKFSTTTDAIKNLNNLSNSTIKLGQVLRVRGTTVAVPPEPSHGKVVKKRSYTVKKGDTLGGIAAQYKISAKSLKSANGISKDQVKVGQKLTIP